jgi:hypothetical protein
MSVLDISKLVSPVLHKEQSDVDELKENPVLIFFKEKERNKIEFTGLTDTNNSITELKRMISRRHQIPSN